MFEHEIMTAGELLDKQLPSKPTVVEGMLPTSTFGEDVWHGLGRG